VGRHVVLLFILLFAIAAVSRKRPLWFSAWCAVLMPLPVLFIPPRGFFVMYLPLAGCAMFMAGTLVSARDRFVNPTINRFAGRLLPLGLCLSAVLFGLTDSEFRTHAWTPDPMSRTIDLSKQDWMTLNEPLPPGATILLMGSRFPAEANEWFPYMIAQVLYRDRGLGLYRADAINPSPTPAEFSQYDRVVVFDGSRLKIEMRTPIASGSPRLPSTAPAWR
jgi:hypothetical protein